MAVQTTIPHSPHLISHQVISLCFA